MIIRHNTGEVTLDVIDDRLRVRYGTDSGYSWWRMLTRDECIEAADLLVTVAQNMLTGEKKELFCSFCGKSQYLVRKLIAGPVPSLICDECVALCTEIINEATPDPKALPSG